MKEQVRQIVGQAQHEGDAELGRGCADRADEMWMKQDAPVRDLTDVVAVDAVEAAERPREECGQGRREDDPVHPVRGAHRNAQGGARAQSLGSPSTRSPMMLRWISLVPPAIVY